jgi:hypothetical protein
MIGPGLLIQTCTTAAANCGRTRPQLLNIWYRESYTGISADESGTISHA